jgi:hypothetical protein
VAKGVLLNGDFVWKTRQRLLGLGIFKSVLLYMKKGKTPGTAHLVIECEDDQNVLGSWAMGAMAGVSYDGSASHGARDDNEVPVDFQWELVGRNMAKRLHRAELGLGLDANGGISAARFAWGVPGFAAADKQIDAQLNANNVRQRYFDCFGFCVGGSTIVSRDAGDYSWWGYGLAFFHNDGDRYAMPGFPSLVIGPQLSLAKDTRLKGFIMGDGYAYGTSFVLSAQRALNSNLQMNAAYTKSLWDFMSITVDGKALFVGPKGLSTRLASAIDLPLYHERGSAGDHAKLYLKWQRGTDRYNSVDLLGTATTIGIRCHSFGLIVDMAFKVVSLPDEIAPPPSQSVGGVP